jgi:hypothetical protein
MTKMNTLKLQGTKRMVKERSICVFHNFYDRKNCTSSLCASSTEQYIVPSLGIKLVMLSGFVLVGHYYVEVNVW